MLFFSYWMLLIKCHTAATFTLVMCTVVSSCNAPSCGTVDLTGFKWLLRSCVRIRGTVVNVTCPVDGFHLWMSEIGEISSAGGICFTNSVVRRRACVSCPHSFKIPLHIQFLYTCLTSAASVLSCRVLPSSACHLCVCFTLKQLTVCW